MLRSIITALLVVLPTGALGAGEPRPARGYVYSPPRYFMAPPVYYHLSVFAPPVIEVHPVPVAAPVWLEPTPVPPPLPYRPVAPLHIIIPVPRVAVVPAPVYYEVEVKRDSRHVGYRIEYELDD